MSDVQNLKEYKDPEIEFGNFLKKLKEQEEFFNEFIQ